MDKFVTVLNTLSVCHWCKVERKGIWLDLMSKVRAELRNPCRFTVPGCLSLLPGFDSDHFLCVWNSLRLTYKCAMSQVCLHPYKSYWSLQAARDLLVRVCQREPLTAHRLNYVNDITKRFPINSVINKRRWPSFIDRWYVLLTQQPVNDSMFINAQSAC